MTTTIPSKTMPGLKSLKVEKSRSAARTIYLNIQGERDLEQIHVEASALLDALSTELGVLTIDKADLPEVEPERAGYSGYVGLDGESDPVPLLGSVDLHRHEALRHLALAEYLEAHPPVDEQQVEALVTLLNETSDGHAQSAPIIARRLIATGKVTVQS